MLRGSFIRPARLARHWPRVERQSEARPFLQLAVEVGKAAGFADVQEVEAMLRRLPSAEA